MHTSVNASYKPRASCRHACGGRERGGGFSPDKAFHLGRLPHEQLTRRHRDLRGLRLQDEGAKSFVNSWHELMDVIARKSAALAKAS